jgi:hypothetical protein
MCVGCVTGFFLWRIIMRTIDVIIKGTTPMLQNRFNEKAEVQEATRSVIVDHGTPREQAEKAVYRNGHGFYFPSTWIVGTIKAAGENHKLKGSRKSAKYLVPAAVNVKEITIPIKNGDGKSLAKDFEVDSRPVTIPATKGRIMRHRPRFDDWSAGFVLLISELVLPEDFVQKLLTEAGEQRGIGDFRPTFGRFRVTLWKIHKG